MCIVKFINTCSKVQFHEPKIEINISQERLNNFKLNHTP